MGCWISLVIIVFIISVLMIIMLTGDENDDCDNNYKDSNKDNRNIIDVGVISEGNQIDKDNSK